MSDIPMAREIIKKMLSDMVLDRHVTARLEEALGLMTRKSPRVRGPNSGRRLTSMERWDVRRKYLTGLFTQSELAARYGVNPGRISEIINDA